MTPAWQNPPAGPRNRCTTPERLHHARETGNPFHLSGVFAFQGPLPGVRFPEAASHDPLPRIRFPGTASRGASSDTPSPGVPPFPRTCFPGPPSRGLLPGRLIPDSGRIWLCPASRADGRAVPDTCWGHAHASDCARALGCTDSQVCSCSDPWPVPPAGAPPRLCIQYGVPRRFWKFLHVQRFPASLPSRHRRDGQHS